MHYLALPDRHCNAQRHRNKNLVKFCFISQEALCSVSQIDLVPTLSLLLGTPIPFSNLGSVIPELFSLPPADQDAPSSSKNSSHIKRWSQELQSLYNKVAALRTNAYQVNTYLRAYSKISEEFPQAYFSQLQTILDSAEAGVKGALKDASVDEEAAMALLRNCENIYVDYLNRVKETCRSMWARFDMTLIILGLSITIGACFLTHVLLTHNHNFGNRSQLDTALGTLLKVTAVTIIVCVLMSIMMSAALPSLQLHSTVLILTIPAVGSLLNSIVWIVFLSTEMKASSFVKLWNYSSKTLVSVALTFLYSMCLTSNSFVVYESYVVSFFANSLQFVCVCSIGSVYALAKPTKEQARKKAKAEKSRDIGHFLTHPVTLFVLLAVAFHTCVRFSNVFFACREEQNQSQETDLLRPLGSFSDDSGSYRNYRYLLSVACLAVIPASLTFWLNKQGNLNGGSAPMLSVVYALPFATVSICLNWGLQALPQKMVDSLPPWQQVLMPRVAYSMLLFSFVSVLWNPLCIYLVPRDKHKKKIDYPGEGETVVPKLFNHLKNTWKRSPRQPNRIPEESQLDPDESAPPVVYGLGTVYSSVCLLVSASVALLLALLLGDGLSPAVITMLIQMLIFLELYAVIRKQQLAPLEAVPDLLHFGKSLFSLAGLGLIPQR